MPDNQLPTLDERVDDLRAVMDALAERAALHGLSAGGNMSALCADRGAHVLKGVLGEWRLYGVA